MTFLAPVLLPVHGVSTRLRRHGIELTGQTLCEPPLPLFPGDGTLEERVEHRVHSCLVAWRAGRTGICECGRDEWDAGRGILGRLRGR